ncbi:FtsH protease activity modulator HflK [Pleionea sp. CnH1-48]|uniref:FtsH protease activity modulator HflK n=1 Tax=Pleionea sp. CnH1-48 TaxID=2954494 RepID=UPI002098655E|nr:FtsH protease activity modulator HflK [Pleionea sp. CnH1-48]MCO7224862.1 FtsH protease activity modulator HflK [Pleionea sp. CnH1-48]
MTWNSPGNNNGNKDPWGNRNKQDGPPDLDKMMKDLWGKISKGGGPGSPSSGGMKGFFATGLIVAVVAWFLLGFYTVKEAEKGVILHFGKFDSVVESGLGWIPLGIQTIKKVNVSQIKQAKIEGVMLTKDINIIKVEIGIQYKINNPRDYLFNLSSPENALRQASESALRQVIGDNNVDAILTSEKERIRIEIMEELRKVLAQYHAGLKVETVTLERTAPPSAVNTAFEDVNKAEQDAKRVIQDAEAYRNEKLPLARADAEQLRQQAAAYKAQVLAKANGEVARFNQLLPQYEAAPEVTRNRLYIETMESVLSSSTKVMMDTKAGNNMMYLPLDQLIKNKGGK